jgi:hypothetical protein
MDLINRSMSGGASQTWKIINAERTVSFYGIKSQSNKAIE